MLSILFLIINEPLMCFTQRELYALFELTSLGATRNSSAKKPPYIDRYSVRKRLRCEYPLSLMLCLRAVLNDQTSSL